MNVLVLGSGLAGVATAWFLNRHGLSVTVVDRCEKAAMETSFANAGMLTPSMADPWNAPGVVRKLLGGLGHEDSPMLLRLRALPSMALWGMRFLRHSRPDSYRANTIKNVRLANYSLSTLRSLRDDLSVAYDQSANGTMKIFRDHPSLETFRRLAELLAEHGVEYRVLDAREAVHVEPALAPVGHELAGAIHYPGDESGDARLFCQALAERAQAQGVEFRFQTPVRKLNTAGGRVLGAETAAGLLEADTYVLAAGSYSSPLLKSTGIRLPVRPVKGYSITVSINGWTHGPRLPIIDEHLHAAITPLGARLRVAGTAELAGYDTSIRQRRIDNLVKMLWQVLPASRSYVDRSRVESWAGLRPMSADGVSVLGATALSNLFLNTGHGHLGWTMSAGAGKLVADEVAGKRPDLDLQPYRINRYAAY